MTERERDDADERPLGDTPEAHDEIGPHDLRPDSPGRHAAEKQAGGLDGTTTGHEEGGAAGRGGPAEDSSDRRVSDEETSGGARVREKDRHG